MEASPDSNRNWYIEKSPAQKPEINWEASNFAEDAPIRDYVKRMMGAYYTTMPTVRTIVTNLKEDLRIQGLLMPEPKNWTYTTSAIRTALRIPNVANIDSAPIINIDTVQDLVNHQLIRDHMVLRIQRNIAANAATSEWTCTAVPTEVWSLHKWNEREAQLGARGTPTSPAIQSPTTTSTTPPTPATGTTTTTASGIMLPTPNREIQTVITLPRAPEQPPVTNQTQASPGSMDVPMTSQKDTYATRRKKMEEVIENLQIRKDKRENGSKKRRKIKVRKDLKARAIPATGTPPALIPLEEKEPQLALTAVLPPTTVPLPPTVPPPTVMAPPAAWPENQPQTPYRKAIKEALAPQLLPRTPIINVNPAEPASEEQVPQQDPPQHLTNCLATRRLRNIPFQGKNLGARPEASPMYYANKNIRALLVATLGQRAIDTTIMTERQAMALLSANLTQVRPWQAPGWYTWKYKEEERNAESGPHFNI